MQEKAASVRQAFAYQAKSCQALGSPFTARLCALCGERLQATDGPVARRLLSWPGDPATASDAVALRLMGGLHALVLNGADRDLASVYPPSSGVTDDRLWQAVSTALARHSDHLLGCLDNPPQTNEVRRSGALFVGLSIVAAQTGLPLVLSEIGASAGLNLHADRFAYRFGATDLGDPSSSVRIEAEWRGGPPPDTAYRVHARAGCDLRPLDPAVEADRLRLLSYIWPDQPDRLNRTRAALALAAAGGVRVDRADAVAWLEDRFAVRHAGMAHVVCHTIAWQYLPPAARQRGEALMADAGARATRDAPLAWLRLEDDGERPGAGLRLRLWPDGTDRLLARVDFHGRWIDWRG